MRKKYPEAKIIYAAPHNHLPMLEFLCDEVDGLIDSSMSGLSSLASLIKNTVKLNPDLIFEPHTSGRTYKLFSAISALTGAKYKFYKPSKKGSISVCCEHIGENVSQDILTYGKLAIECENESPDYREFEPKVNRKQMHDKTISISPISSESNKCLPINDFLTLMEYVIKKHPQYKILCPIGPTALDEQFATSFPDHIKNKINIIKVPLDELVPILSQCSGFVGMDTGIKHLSAELGVRTFTFMHERHMSYSHPYSDKDAHQTILLGTSMKDTISELDLWLEKI